jgi:hypothetical protein
VEDFPLKKQKKPPMVDSRLLNLSFCLKRSAVCHPALLKRGQSTANVASVKQQPSADDQVLIDSGATDSVTNNDFFLP